MLIRSISRMGTIMWLVTAPVLAGGNLSSPCLMHPPYLSIRLPDSGFTWLPGGDFKGTCENVPREGWKRKTSGAMDLYVHADGPAGSGRFWKVTVGISGKEDSNPLRGVCVSTSTVGWRTMQRYSKGLMLWLDDVDDDGSAEFILWDSFAINEEASLAEYALVAWVYRLVSEDSLIIDWELSRGLARSIAEEYRTPVDTTNGLLGELRTKAAEALEMFADGRCSISNIEAR